ncbi:MAG: glutathione S-transferase family protein [Gammaproteobacteria bacterium AqS3]|nr:glutathione S-transferase family protein [Gammaproteobacteria bacterium AqS3]
MTDITIWGANTPRTLRPIWMAEELGLEYKLHPIGSRTGETQTSEFATLNPKNKIPVFQAGDVLLTESLAICRYLRQAFPSPALPAPQGDAALAKEDEWCCYIFGELDETSLYVMRRHYDLNEIYGDAPLAIETCRDHLEQQFKILNVHLSDTETVLASGFGLADIMLISCLDWAAFYNCRMPRSVEQYRERIAKRPAYKKAMDVNYKAMMEILNGAA